MGRAGPPFEPHHRPQAGKSGDPRSQNADSSPRAQGAPGLGRAGRRKGKGEAPRALTACGLGHRVAVDWTWVSPQPRELIRERHLPRSCFLLSPVAAQIPFLAPLLPSSKFPDLLRPRDLGSHGTSSVPDRSLVLVFPGVAERVGGEPCPVALDGGGAGIDGAKVFKAGSATPEGKGS